MAPPHSVAPPDRKADRVMDFGFRISDFGRSMPTAEPCDRPPDDGNSVRAAETCDSPRRHPKSEIRNPKSFSKLLLPRCVESNRTFAGFDIEVDDLVRLRRDHLLIFGKVFEPPRIAQ